MATNNSCLNLQNFTLNNIHQQKEIVSDIIDRKTSLLSVVESLGSVLTHEDKALRKRGVEFMSWILSQLPLNFLNEKEIVYFSNFYCDRLKDHHSVIPDVLQGVSFLVTMKNINGKSVCDLLHTIFQLVTCQSQVAQDRRAVYNIIKSCSQLHMSSITNIGADFMYGVITSMEGETDPQNLVLIFSFLPKLLYDLQVKHLMADTFEVLSTYFPVDFTTVEKDGIVITRDDLADGLGRCLAANEQLAVECIPLIIEKLESTLRVAKLDSYKLMQRCCERLVVKSIEPHLSSLWKLAQRDLLPPVDDNIQREALLTITSLVGILATVSDSLNSFLDDVIVGVRSLLNRPTDSLFVPAMKILQAICPKSDVAQKRALLEIRVLFEKKSESDCEAEVLLKATLPFLSYINEDDTETINAVASYCVSAAKNSSVRILSFLSLDSIFSVLSKYDHLRQSVYKLILTTLTTNKDTKCFDAFEKLLRTVAMSSACAGEFKEAVVDAAYLLSSDSLFFLLAALIDIQPFTASILSQFVHLGTQPEFSSQALSSLLKCCERGRICEDVMIHLEKIVLDLAVRCESNSQTLSHLLKYVMASRSSQRQMQIIETYQHTLITPIFSHSCPLQNKVMVLEGLVGALRSDVDISILHEITTTLLSKDLSCEEHVVRQSAARILAAFVNKMSLDYVQSVINVVSNQSLADDTNEEKVELYGWILKGVLLRGLPQIDSLLAQWFFMLNNSSVGSQVAQFTSCLLQEDPVFLNASAHCTVKFLYRQRLFYCLPSVVAHMKTLENGVIRDNHLEALVHVAAGVPEEVVKSDEGSVAVVVCLALQTERISVTSPTLELLQTLLNSRATLFSDHITSLLPSLIKLTVPPTTLFNRQAALRCLFLAANYPTHLTLPFKSQVVRSLVNCLDDRKRLVRSEAARTRGRWCLVGAAGEEAFLS